MVDLDGLLNSLSLEEKVAQLSCGGRLYEMPDVVAGSLDTAEFAARFPDGTGQLGRPSVGRDADTTFTLTSAIQHTLEARSHLPALFNEEGVHGLMGGGATVFPAALAMAATWDVDLVEQVYAAVARETRNRGSNYVYAPVLDLARDPRWGRIEETFGEDPFLVAQMGLATIHGLQGRTYQIAADRVVACAKHFVGHGLPQAGNNGAPVQIGPRELISEHAYPFEVAIQQGRVGAIMAAYHDWDGIPTHANSELLTHLLRDDLGFEGMVTSDGFGIPQLETLHRVASDPTDAARQAFAAGVDCQVPEPGGTANFVAEVRAGRLSVETVDRACRNILAVKDRLGLFDRTADTRVEIDRQAHRELSREVAVRGIVLLANDAGVLPLDPGNTSRVAVSGPNASDAHLGGYTDPDATGISILDGIRARFASSQVVLEEGCRITERPTGAKTWWIDSVDLADPDLDDDRISAAVASATEAEVAIVVIGGNEATQREGWWFDHLGDRSELTMAGRQDELVERVAATGTTTIAVVVSGGPVDLRRTVAAADAVLWTSYAGEAGGHAVADVLAGIRNPEGRLPITFPRSSGQIPIHGNRRPSAGRGYFHESAEPLFGFGHGLSYTEFAIDEVRVEPPEISVADLEAGSRVEVLVRVTNTGGRRGRELIRVAVEDTIATVTQPRKPTRGFARVDLASGASVDVAIPLPRDAFRLLDRDLDWVVEPGRFEIDVFGSNTTVSTPGVVVVA